MILFEFITLFPPKIELVGIFKVSPLAHLKGNAVVTFPCDFNRESPLHYLTRRIEKSARY